PEDGRRSAPRLPRRPRPDARLHGRPADRAGARPGRGGALLRRRLGAGKSRAARGSGALPGHPTGAPGQFRRGVRQAAHRGVAFAVMKTSAIKRKGDSALAELARTYEMLREQLADRLDEIDTRALGNRAYSYSKDLRQRVEDRVRPKPRRRFPLAAALALGAAIGIGFLLYDRRRRDMV